ncbi:helix-turn-helix domain-containing protein [Massilia endophytica]|uniref:helix-turn-helix domain-containing protein n=1 Tax=Massilia endophytica TaxID=2899220 RepID=UPI001E2B5CDF|nr:helix-turn-helix domain-containing protein [Massilia endophytica]UGQ44558.1 helix-turn-helix transcriptional regulator [Massilia endophytica]
MQEFYKKALLALIGLVIANALLASLLVYQSYLSVSLRAAARPGAGWQYITDSDVNMAGTSTVRIPDRQREDLRFEFKLTRAAQYPFVAAGMALLDARGQPATVDWSKYTDVTFLARCAPANSMFFSISTFDAKVSKVGDFQTYRSPSTYFSCNERGVPVSLDLTRLSVPDWWFNAVKLDLTYQGYELNRVSRVVFGSSSQSPFNVDSYLEIGELTLHGRDYRYIVALALVLVASWGTFALWFFRAHSRALTASLNSRMKKDLPLVAYRQLTLEPYKDKEKATVLRFIATNYTNTELDLDGVVSGTGTNRNKVNELLKNELGMTFTSYLNKLRLTEAARLLAEKSTATVAEIAYLVGYSNVSYFNKLFKEEYGCTPKAFRSIAALSENQPAPAAEAP